MAIFLVALFLAACTASPAGAPADPVDPDLLVIYHNGRVLTMLEETPIGEAIAVRGEKIIAVGTNEEIQALEAESARVIDLENLTVMPGFVDAHTHILNDARSQGLSLDEAQALALRSGITTIGDLYVDESFLEEIQAFADAGYLRIRTGLYLVATDPCGKRLGDWWKEHPPTREPGEMLRINGVKIFSDGGSCGKVALSFELEPGWGSGDLWFTQDELNALVDEVDAAGYQAAVHAIGDRAVTASLNAIEYALHGRPNDLRHRMEHVSVIRPEDLPRFGALGVVPVLIGEYPNCTPYGPPLPAEYGPWEWPWRALREANPGLPIAWHSDVPFQSINPFDHLLGFTTRIDEADGRVCPPAVRLTENMIDVEEALLIMTIQSAYALGRETEVGSLAPGKYADFIVITGHPLEVQLEDLARNKVLLTVVGGGVAYCAPGNRGLCPGHRDRQPVGLADIQPPAGIVWTVAAVLAAVPLSAMRLQPRLSGRVLRVLRAAAGLGGAVWLGVLFTPGWGEGIFSGLPFLLASFLTALGVPMLAVVRTDSMAGKAGLWAAAVGNSLVIAANFSNLFLETDVSYFLLMVGLLSHAAGLIVFGAAAWRALRWNLLPILVGLLAFPVPLILGFVLPESSDLPWAVLIGGMGLGWLAISLRFDRNGESPEPAHPQNQQ